MVKKLHEADVMRSQGATVAVVSKKIRVNAHIYYRWRKDYGGMRLEQAHQFKELEQEHSLLKKLVAALRHAD